MQGFVDLLVQTPILTLFLVIGLGFLVGEIPIFGFRFGVAAVLFVGLGVGALSPKIGVPDAIPTLGLIIFVYTIGIASAPALKRGFRERGYRDSLLAIAVLAFAAALTAGMSYLFAINGAQASGLYCGALTNTPALAAARETLREVGARAGLQADAIRAMADQPTVAYSIAYPIGVVGVILAFQLFGRYWRKKDDGAVDETPEITVANFSVRNPAIFNLTLHEILSFYPERTFVVSRVLHKGVSDIATSNSRLSEGDIVAVVADETGHAMARQIFGERSETHIELDRSRLDYRRVFVSSKEVVGKRIRDLDLQNRMHAIITRVRRGDVDVVPNPNTRLELGDRIRVLTLRERFADISKFFGDSIRGAAEMDFGSVALGMVIGVLVGMIPIPLPGGSTVRMGLAGGPLLAALVLGNVERTGRINWAIPISANLTLRQIGLLLFLAGVGTRAGWDFLQTLQTSGVRLVLAGAVITFTVTLVTMFAAHRYLKMPFESVMGMMSGIQTQPACLAFANNQTRSDAPNIAYASVYPAATVAKIVLAQILASWPVWS